MSSYDALSTPPPVDALHFRRACSKFATGITVVTVLGEDGLPHGMTVNSFSSVSLHPPLISVSIDRRATILHRLLGASSLAINILTEHQREISHRFAHRVEDRFDNVEWFPGELGVPVLPDVLGVLECSLWQTVEAGDHYILISEVRAVKWAEGRPLLYFDSSYQILG